MKRKRFVGFRLRKDLDNRINKIHKNRPGSTKTDILQEAIEKGLKYLKTKR